MSTHKGDETAKKKMKKPRKTKGRPDEDLFGNTDDIFAGLPDAEPKRTAKKKKKKKTTTEAEAATATEVASDKGTISHGL